MCLRACNHNQSISIDDIKVTSSMVSSQGENSECARSIRSFKCKNSMSGGNPDNFNLDIPEIQPAEGDIELGDLYTVETS